MQKIVSVLLAAASAPSSLVYATPGEYAKPKDATAYATTDAAYAPLTADGYYCPNVTVLMDVATGWLGGCEGLKEVKDITTTAECKATCEKKMECAIWQMVGLTEPSGGKCWHSDPSAQTWDCSNRGGDFKTDGSQRIQHGTISDTVVDLKGMQLSGLVNHPLDDINDDEKAGHCKKICYSIIACNHWTYDVTAGCQIETELNRAKFLKDGTEVTIAEAALGATTTHGEKIKRTCPGWAKVPPKENNDTIWIIVLSVLGVLILGGISAYLLKPKPVAKKTRAVKIEPKKEQAPEMVPLFVPQPTVMIPQRSVMVYR